MVNVIFAKKQTTCRRIVRLFVIGLENQSAVVCVPFVKTKEKDTNVSSVEIKIYRYIFFVVYSCE